MESENNGLYSRDFEYYVHVSSGLVVHKGCLFLRTLEPFLKSVLIVKVPSSEIIWDEEA
jgi:hypothetical protein